MAASLSRVRSEVKVGCTQPASSAIQMERRACARLDRKSPEMASNGGGYASMTRRKSEPKLSLYSDRSTLPQDSAAYLLFLEAQVAKNLTTPQQLHALDERMAALAAAQKAVATRCSELDNKISGSVRLVKIAQAYAEQVRERAWNVFSRFFMRCFGVFHSPPLCLSFPG